MASCLVNGSAEWDEAGRTCWEEHARMNTSMLEAWLGAEMLKGRECTFSHLLVLSHPLLPPEQGCWAFQVVLLNVRPDHKDSRWISVLLRVTLNSQSSYQLSVGITGKLHGTQFMLC